MPECPYCGRSCKTARGVTQHIDRTAACSLAQSATVGSQEGSNILGEDAGLEGINSGQGSSRTIPGSHSRRSRNQPIKEQKQERKEGEEEATVAGNPDDKSVSLAHSDGEDFFVGSPEANSSEGEAQGSPGSAAPTHGEANTQIPEDFHQYCDTHDTKFEPLDTHTIKSIKLMNILRRTKAPLNAYQPFLEWHLKETGHLCDDTMTLTHPNASPGQL